MPSNGSIAPRVRRVPSSWLVRRRRACATCGKSGSRRTLVAFPASLVLLLGLFAAAIGYVRPPGGREPTLDRLSQTVEGFGSVVAEGAG